MFTLQLLFIGTTEMLLIAGVALLLFGGKKLPEMMRGMGQGVKEFKKGMHEMGEPVEEVKDTIKEAKETIKEATDLAEEQTVRTDKGATSASQKADAADKA